MKDEEKVAKAKAMISEGSLFRPKFQAAALGRCTSKLLRTHKHFLHLIIIIRSARLAHEDSYFYYGSKAVTEYSPPWCCVHLCT